MRDHFKGTSINLNDYQMKKTLLFLLILISISSLYAQQKDKRLKGLDKELQEVLEVSKAAGFSVAVVEKDQIVYSKGFGFRDYEKQLPIDGNTLFAIGSSTKAFTSALLGQLRDETEMTFEDKPSKYLPELQFYNEEMNSQIIIRDLMCHRTGLPRHDISWYFFPNSNKDSLIARVKHMEPFTGVRQQWYYNNFMFLAQGLIAEKITGKNWEENIRERFFIPLGMDRSRLRLEEIKDMENVALGYNLDGENLKKMDYYEIGGMAPAGSIFSTANDVSKWLIAWIHNGKFNDKQVFPEAYALEAISSQMVINAALPSAEYPGNHFSNYGLGWFLSSYSGHYRVEHGGNIDGFSANVAFFPSDSLGIVVLANQNATPLPSIVRNIIADKMLEIKGRDWVENYKNDLENMKEGMEKMSKDKNAGRIAHTQPSHFLVDYAGEYSHPGYGKFKITTRNDSLFAHFKLINLWLKHFHYDVFEPYRLREDGSIDTSGQINLKFNFQTNDSGDITSLSSKIEAALDPITFKRTPFSYAVATDDLTKYAGDYTLLGTTIKISTRENKLFLFVKGQPEYQLISTAEHKFNFKDLDGFKVEFKEETDGSIKEALLIQPHGNYTIVKSEE
jgi:CubicO group peptidase (beta-lactamase class C family)